MNIRPYASADLDALRQLFQETVLAINRRDYTQAQVEAWASSANDRSRWVDRLAAHHFVAVAEIDSQIVGFAELEASGHIDCFYCHKDFQNQGIGTQLLDRLEAEARSIHLPQLFTEASITAKPFFERRGFQVVRSQQVERLGQIFTNFQMTKSLS
ncbi:MAG: GNAT family N-acetyltransferase [Leptolyngbyaceae cyanobacterium SM1_3_5]|nr:GNAT family N-acetyltransferase [Leptolyngbyaceae cyanobacterium SM1_3_5]